MKLLDLLVQELPRRGGWPENVTHIGQDYDRELMFYGRGNVMSGIIIDELAIDHRKSGKIGVKITREQYESALAASDGWIEWGGGECPPVTHGTMVDVKLRDGSVFFNKQCWGRGYSKIPGFKVDATSEAGGAFWRSESSQRDIIAYRPHKPDINSRANDDRLEQDLNECIGASEAQLWNGDGVPPIGCACEMQDSKGTWLPVEIIAKNDGFTFGWSYDYRLVFFVIRLMNSAHCAPKRKRQWSQQNTSSQIYAVILQAMGIPLI